MKSDENPSEQQLPSAQLGMSQSFSQYDFPTLTNQLRLLQLGCLIVEMILVHSVSGTLSGMTFLIYSLLVMITLAQITGRWFYNIDGRYDIRQLVNEPEVKSKLPYMTAVFSPLIMGLLCYKFVVLAEGGVAAGLFSYLAITQFAAAALLTSLEIFEVFIKSN